MCTGLVPLLNAGWQLFCNECFTKNTRVFFVPILLQNFFEFGLCTQSNLWAPDLERIKLYQLDSQDLEAKDL